MDAAPAPTALSAPAAVPDAARADLLAALPSFVYRSEAFAEDLLSPPALQPVQPVSRPVRRFGWPTRR